MFCVRDFEIKYRKFDILVGNFWKINLPLGVKDSAENKENKEVQNDGEQNTQTGNIDKLEETFNQDQ